MKKFNYIRVMFDYAFAYPFQSAKIAIFFDILKGLRQKLRGINKFYTILDWEAFIIGRRYWSGV